MKTYGAPTLAALASGQIGCVQLLYLGFPSGAIALNNSTWTLEWLSVSYLKGYGIGSISPVTDRPGELQGLKLSLAAGDDARIALALDSANEVQGSQIVLRTALVELVNYTILEAPIEWQGKMDTMTISEDNSAAVINVSCESKGVDLLRGTPSFYADPDQRRIDAADGAFRFVVDQVGKRVVWPARSYFLR